MLKCLTFNLALSRTPIFFVSLTLSSSRHVPRSFAEGEGGNPLTGYSHATVVYGFPAYRRYFPLFYRQAGHFHGNDKPFTHQPLKDSYLRRKDNNCAICYLNCDKLHPTYPYQTSPDLLLGGVLVFRSFFPDLGSAEIY